MKSLLSQDGGKTAQVGDPIRPAERRDLLFQVLGSESLHSWSDSPVLHRIDDRGDGTVTETWRAAEPMGASSSRFLKLDLSFRNRREPGLFFSAILYLAFGYGTICSRSPARPFPRTGESPRFIQGRIGIMNRRGTRDAPRMVS